MNTDGIDGALHEIRQMVVVALNANEYQQRSETTPEYFQMRAEHAEMLCFALFDVLKRVEALRDELNPRERAATVLTLVPGGAS